VADTRTRPADHAAHDTELVARSASGELAASEAIAARDLLAGCPACASLAEDLRAIMAATRTLPDAAAIAAHRPAPRDFRLAPADAARLRPAGLAGLVRRLAGFDLGFGARARGLGGAMVSLGLVGLLVSAGVPALLGGAAGGAAEVDLGGLPAKSGPTQEAGVPGASGIYALSTAGDGTRLIGDAREEAPTPSTPWALITAGSIVVATAGLVLVVLGWRARRARPEGT
jgi:anti-sigma factor RsiW